MEEDVKSAYETLGLPEEAAKEEVEKRYFILIRRARASQQREGGDPAEHETVDIDEVNRAYRLILDMEERKLSEAYNEKVYGKYRKMAGSAQKVDHFFSYYKFHLLGAIAVIALIIYGINAYIDHKHKQEELAKLPPANLEITFFGNYLSNDTFNPDLKPVEDKIVSQFPDWKRVIAHLTYVPAQIQTEQDTAFIQKSILDLITNKSDVYVLDKANFAKLAAQGALKPLGSGDTAALQPYAADKGLKATTEDDPAEKVYGIDITGSPLIKELQVRGTEYIAGIRADSTRTASAVQFIERYASAK
ncbi:J domain-containing protein [Paenibacillus humicola]|uniref:J domain-containing protein n=1 Tax=Paenibacillus humicola TaxID=3110540 RepID=UPI00237A609F|nr:J domain-containing protein [Paenibacillus humicola]